MQRTGLGAGRLLDFGCPGPPVQAGRMCEGLWAGLNKGQVAGLEFFSAWDLGALDPDLLSGPSL